MTTSPLETWTTPPSPLINSTWQIKNRAEDDTDEWSLVRVIAIDPGTPEVAGSWIIEPVAEFAGPQRVDPTKFRSLFERVEL